MPPLLWLQKLQKTDLKKNIGEKIERRGKHKPTSTYSLPRHIA